VAALRPGPQVRAARRGGQRVQHGADQGGARGGQLAAQHPGSVQGGLQEHFPVRVRRLIVIGRGDPAADLGHHDGQRGQVRALGGRGDQDLLGLVPVLRGEGPQPPGQLQRDRGGQRVAAAQRGQQRGVLAGQRGHGQVPGGLPPGDPQGMHQPGPGAALPVGQVAIGGVERGQQPPPGRRADGVGPFQAAQAPGQLGGGHLGGVGIGEVAQRAVQHGQRLGDTARDRGRDRRGAHRGRCHLPPGLDGDLRNCFLIPTLAETADIPAPDTPDNRFAVCSALSAARR
jgi:hypothetical protein